MVSAKLFVLFPFLFTAAMAMAIPGDDTDTSGDSTLESEQAKCSAQSSGSIKCCNSDGAFIDGLTCSPVQVTGKNPAFAEIHAVR